MGFNRKDLEDDDDGFNFGDDNSFDFGDEASGDDSSFDFGDEPSDIGLDDGDKGFGFEDEDMPDIDEDEEAGGGGGGVSRTFIIIAGVMILLFILGLGAVVLISAGGGPPTEFDNQKATIVAANATTAANALLTETAKAIDAGTQTAIALTPQATETLPPTETPNIPTITPTPTLDATQEFANALLTQQASELTQTAEFLLTPQATNTMGFTQGDVELTATALAILLAPGNQPTLVAGVPTQEITNPGVLPTQLPQTGFFDDLAAGNANVGLIALMALGLVGVIVVSRRVRTATK
ncbi:MAG: hypothetical protein ABI690_11800 [Chloroflexota bacterium]